MLSRVRPWALVLSFAAFASPGAHAEGQALDDDALKAITAGKTHREYFQERMHHEIFFQPDGRAFVVFKVEFHRPLMEISWNIEHGMLCIPDFPSGGPPCVPITKLPDGTFQKDYSSGHVTSIREIVDGDPDKLIDQVRPAAVPRSAALDTSVTAILPPGDYLSGEQVKALVAGKTLTQASLREKRFLMRNQKPELHYYYYAADGKAFTLAGQGGLQTMGRGTWDIQNNRLCAHGVSLPCSGIRRIAGGRYQVEYPGMYNSWSVEITDGDTQKIVDTINNTYPYNQKPQVPNEPEVPPNVTVR